MGDETVQYFLREGVASLAGIEIKNMTDVWTQIVPRLEEMFGTPVAFKHGSVEHLPYPDASFDVVVSSAVYEHVRNLNMAVHEQARVLKPGGFATHEIGPLYFSYSGDHCIGLRGLASGYDHLILDEAEYRRNIADDEFFNKKASTVGAHSWAKKDNFSFARLHEYLSIFQTFFKIELLILVISEEGVRYREQYPARWGQLLAAGLTPTDLLVSGIKILLQKP